MSDTDPTIGSITVADAVPSPEISRAPVVAPLAVISRDVEQWARVKKVAPWLLKAAAVGARWQMGPEFEPVVLTEAEFDRAVAFAENPHAAVNAVTK